MELGVELRDDAGTADPTVVVLAGKRVLARVRGGMMPAVPGMRLGAPWRAPAAAPAGLHFCVTALDRAGNRSERSCAPIRLSAPRPTAVEQVAAIPQLRLG
jgi:hypothetical protein